MTGILVKGFTEKDIYIYKKNINEKDIDIYIYIYIPSKLTKRSKIRKASIFYLPVVEVLL